MAIQWEEDEDADTQAATRGGAQEGGEDPHEHTPKMGNGEEDSRTDRTSPKSEVAQKRGVRRSASSEANRADGTSGEPEGDDDPSGDDQRARNRARRLKRLEKKKKTPGAQRQHEARGVGVSSAIDFHIHPLTAQPRTTQGMTHACVLGAHGYTISAIAAEIGVNRTTLQRWRARGHEALEALGNGEEVPEEETLYLEFILNFERARAQLENKLVDTIVETAPYDWRAASWFLERSFQWGKQAPEAQKVEVEVTGKAEIELRIMPQTHAALRKIGSLLGDGEIIDVTPDEE